MSRRLVLALPGLLCGAVLLVHGAASAHDGTTADAELWAAWGNLSAAFLARVALFAAGLVLLGTGVDLARRRAASDPKERVAFQSHWGGLGGGVGGFELSRGLTEILLVIWLTGLGTALLLVSATGLRPDAPPAAQDGGA